MKKNMLSTILAILTFVYLFATAASCSWCGNQTPEDGEKTDVETEYEAVVEESEGEPVEAGNGI